MVNQWDYSDKLTPPSPPYPVIDVILFKPWSTTSPVIAESLQVDSGADITGIPLKLIRKLRPRPLDPEGAYAFDGKLVKNIPIYEIGIEIIGKRFNTVRVFGLDTDLGFIGRDLLNNFLITLDGPAYLATVT